MVYVNDVVQLNMRWPFGVLQYSNGLLAGSEFTYSSGGATSTATTWPMPACRRSMGRP